MVRKTIFLALGLTIAILGYGWIESARAEPQPVKAQRLIDYTFSKPVHVAPKNVAGVIRELTWATLTDVTFKDVYIKEQDMYYWKPTFGPSVKAVEGKEVYITGYVIPVDLDENFYVISRYPYANCYFCGGGGPESVVDLRFAGKNRTYKTDERLTFKGKLKLNATDIYQMNYILEGVTEYQP
ncbi:MAG: hypothetical protein ACKO6L_06160 [Flavobacteriales bacterium]